MAELSKDQMAIVNKIEDQCCALMAGRGPAVQSAVMACLLARHLASFAADEDRVEAEQILLGVTRELVPLYRQSIVRHAREGSADDSAQRTANAFVCIKCGRTIFTAQLAPVCLRCRANMAT